MAMLLGVNLGHDASACVLENDCIIVAVSQERLNRIKHSHFYPNSGLIEYCLEVAGISPSSLDAICLHHVELPPPMSRGLRRFDDIPFVRRWLLTHDFWHPAFDLCQNIYFISHHLAHAWSSTALSGYDECAVVVIDVMGSCLGCLTEDPCPRLITDGHLHARERESLYHYHSGNMQPLQKRASFPIEDSRYNPSTLKVYDGVGGLYEVIGQYLFHSELMGGKVMGLASYADSYPTEPLFTYSRGLPEVARLDWLENHQSPFVWSDDFNQAAKLAALSQHQLEEALVRVTEYALDITGSSRVCLAGGMMLNGVATELVRKKLGPENVFAPTACNDAGISVGCAYALLKTLDMAPPQHAIKHDFWGRCYSQSDCIEAVCQDRRVRIQRKLDLEHVAYILHKDQVVGYFAGGSEFGPRALGHRSILASPHREAMRDHVNKSVKQREWFRPLAPCVPEEEAGIYFDIQGDSPFMLRVCQVRDAYKEQLSAITHVDGTTRVQTVSREVHPELHELLYHYKELSGIPVLINTSFNSRGMPIVETPWEALDTFLARSIDLLILEDYEVIKQTIDSWDFQTVRPVVRQLETFEWGENLGPEVSWISRAVRMAKSCFEPIVLKRSHMEILGGCTGSKTLAEIVRGQELLYRAAIELWKNGIITWEV